MTTLYDGNLDPESPTQALGTQPPVLIVTSAGRLEGRALRLDRSAQLIGRGADCDLRLDDPYVSRRHAVLRRESSATIIEDLGSSAGVVLNGKIITRATALHGGDVVRLGEIVLQYREPPTRLPHQPASRAARFDVGAQHGYTIHNVGRDQYHNRLALEIGPMRRRARRLLRLGWALTLIGLAIEIAAAIAFALKMPSFPDQPTTRPPDMPFEYIVVGFAGGAVVIVGVACMISSLFIRRGARRREEQL